MMLTDTAYLGVASIFIQSKRYKAFKNNTTNGCGHGPNQRKTAENSRRAQDRRGEIYAQNLLRHCQVQVIDEEQEDEEIIEINDTNDDDDDMDGWKISTSKSGHKVPKTFKKKNPTKTVKIRKRKFPEGNGDEQRSKVGKTTSSHRMKEPDDRHSYSCNQSDLHKIQQISMSETRNLDILQQNPPRIVIINNSIKKYAGCKRLFGKKERMPPNDLVFHL